MFTGNFPELYRGPESRKQLIGPGVSLTTAVAPGVIWNSHLEGWVAGLLCPEAPVDSQHIDNEARWNVLAAYREYLELCQKAIIELSLPPEEGMSVAGPAIADDRPDLPLPPPCELDAIIRICDQQNIEITHALQIEVLYGRMPYSDELAARGIPDRPVLQNRLDNQRRLEALIRPHALAYATSLGLSEEVVPLLMNDMLRAYSAGADRLSDIIGAGIIAAQDMMALPRFIILFLLAQDFPVDSTRGPALMDLARSVIQQTGDIRRFDTWTVQEC